MDPDAKVQPFFQPPKHKTPHIGSHISIDKKKVRILLCQSEIYAYLCQRNHNHPNMDKDLDISILNAYAGTVPPKKKRALQSLFHKMRTLQSMEEIKEFFNRSGVTIRDQYPLMLMHLERITSSEFYSQATAYLASLRTLMEQAADERRRYFGGLCADGMTSGDVQRRNGPLATFRLTNEGHAAGQPAWRMFMQALTGRYIDASDLDGYRSLLGLSDAPLSAPLPFLGSNQQLMLLFSSLCGTLVYDVPKALEGVAAGRWHAVPFIAMEGSRGFKETERGGTPSPHQPRIADPYCQLLSAALLDRNRQPLTPRSLTSAKNLLGNPAKGISLDKARPLLAALIALGALARR